MNTKMEAPDCTDETDSHLGFVIASAFVIRNSPATP